MTSAAATHLDLAKLPLQEMTNVCQILDQNGSYEELGRLMQFNEFDIANFKAESSRLNLSPSNLLITRWSSRYGHNATELFKLLSVMQNYPAMDAIKASVHSKYYVWYTPNEAQIEAAKKNKELNIRSEIFNKDKARTQKPKKSGLEESLKHLLNIPLIEIDDLKAATNDWDDTNELGRGGFGVVYIGQWLNTNVAIKKLNIQTARLGSANTVENWIQSMSELRFLNQCRHDNILPIYGYSITNEACFVVFQLMEGGSLEERLSWKKAATKGIPPLTWPQRFEIAKGTARGLQYLHRYAAKPLIHGDIKPGNILLDSCCVPKIGDFGLSREGLRDNFQQLTVVFGTRPYLPQEFLTKKLFSTLVDVFSFGVVLFEIATGLRAADKDRKPPMLFDYMATKDVSNSEVLNELIDKSTKNDEACLYLCRLMIEIGRYCTNYNPNDRPDMITVLKALENFKP